MIRFLILLATTISLLVPNLAVADRPSTLKLLPDWTIAMLRIRDASELGEKMSDTGFAQMLRDEEIKPFVEHLYGSATELVRQVEQRLGMTVDEILEIPQGEITLALAAPPAFLPAPVLIFDLPENRKNVESLLQEGVRALKNGGYSLEKETIENTQIEIFAKGVGEGPKQIIRFTREGTLVITTNKRIVQRMLELWSGKDEKTILDNRAFQTIATRCEMGEDTKSHLTWFIDPIGIVRAATRRNPGAALGLAILPAIGLDGFQGLGGSMVLPDSDFEVVTHTHIYLENPRDGVLEMITLKDGDSRPEKWIPEDVINYITVHVDLQKTYSILKDLVDSFQGEGAVSRFVKSRMSDNLGIDVEQDLIAQLEGRMTLIQMYEKPARLNSQASLLGIKVKNREKFQKSFDAIMDKFGDNLETADISGEKVFRVARPDEDENVDEQIDDQRARRRRLRRQTRPQPSFALMDDYLILADRPSFVEKIIKTKADPDLALASSIDFKQTMEKISRQPNGNTASMITFGRPAEALKMIYELIQSDQARQFMSQQREQNGFFRALDDAMTEKPLPPFSKLEKYFTTTGSMITNEETGIHQMSFGLRLDEVE